MRTHHVILASVALVCGTTSGNAVESGWFWRSSDYQDVNVLYCLLGVHGLRMPYVEFFELHSRGDGASSSADLMRIAEFHAMQLETVTMRPDELRQSNLPIIAIMDGSYPGSGAFVLVIGVRGDTVSWLDGRTLILRQAYWDSFLRSWNGYCVAVARSSRQSVKAAFSWVLGVIIGTSLCLSYSLCKRGK